MTAALVISALAGPQPRRRRRLTSTANAPSQSGQSASGDHAAAGHRHRAEGAGRSGDTAGQCHRRLGRRHQGAGITIVSDAGLFSPNTSFTEFTARKLSNRRIRGLGAGPVESRRDHVLRRRAAVQRELVEHGLLDIAQIEFVRGPQSTLFGRNALGGLINIATARPSLTKWTGVASVPFGDYGQQEFRAAASGPIAEGQGVGRLLVELCASATGSRSTTITGNDIDSRSAFAAKGQVLWKPSAAWETRVIVSGERARDGDYALNDLAAVRQNPFEVARDYEGHTDRDIFSTTILARREGEQVHVLEHDRLRELEHLRFDRPRLLAVPARDAQQHRRRFPVHAGSAPRVGGRLAVQAVGRGVSCAGRPACSSSRRTTSSSSCRTSPPFVLPGVPFPVQQHQSRCGARRRRLRRLRAGHAVVQERSTSPFGARVDHESKDADISTSFDPAIAPPTSVHESRSFTDVSPQFGASFRFNARSDGIRLGESRLQGGRVQPGRHSGQ